MRILQISAGANPLKGRSNSYLDALPEALADLGYEVTALQMANSGPWWRGLQVLRQRGKFATIRIHNSGVYAGEPPGTGAIGVAKPLREVLPSKKLRKLFVDILAETKPDVIHIQNLFGLPIHLLREAANHGVPLVMTEHGFYPICPTAHLFLENGRNCCLGREELICGQCSRYSRTHAVFRYENAITGLMRHARKESPLWRMLARVRNGVARLATATRSARLKNRDYIARFDAMCEMLHGLDLLNCISDLQAARLQESTGPLSNLTVRPIVPPSIAVVGPVARKMGARWIPTLGVLNVMAGRDAKGWTYLHRVIALLERTGLDFRVLWYADPNPHPSRIEYRGRYELAHLDEIASEIDACLMPSLHLETLGFVGMEMLSRGVPLICSNRCGVSQMVDSGVTGVVFDPSSEENLYRTLVDLINRPVQLDAMRRAQSQACLKMQTFEEHVREFATMLEQVASRKKVQKGRN